MVSDVALPFKTSNLRLYAAGQVLAEALGDKAGCNRMGRAVAAVSGGRDVDAAGEGEGEAAGAARCGDGCNVWGLI